MTPTRVVNRRIVGNRRLDVYIGRDRHTNGRFGNPVRIGATCPVCKAVHRDGGSTLPCYRVTLLVRLRAEPAFVELVRRLRGRSLACWCKPSPCHGDVLAAVAEALHAGGLEAAEALLLAGIPASLQGHRGSDAPPGEARP